MILFTDEDNMTIIHLIILSISLGVCICKEYFETKVTRFIYIFSFLW